VWKAQVLMGWSMMAAVW